MRKTDETERKKKGFFAILKESMAKTSEGCGPDCGCHADEPHPVGHHAYPHLAHAALEARQRHLEFFLHLAQRIELAKEDGGKDNACHSG